MLKIKLQPYTMNIIFIYNQYFNKMDKLLLNGVGTLGSVFSTYTVGLFSLILNRCIIIDYPLSYSKMDY